MLCATLLYLYDKIYVAVRAFYRGAFYIRKLTFNSLIIYERKRRGVECNLAFVEYRRRTEEEGTIYAGNIQYIICVSCGRIS